MPQSEDSSAFLIRASLEQAASSILGNLNIILLASENVVMLLSKLESWQCFEAKSSVLPPRAKFLSSSKESLCDHNDFLPAPEDEIVLLA